MEIISNSQENHKKLEIETGEGKTLNTLGAEDLDDLGSFVKNGTTNDTITEDLTDSEFDTFDIDLSIDKFVEARFSKDKEFQGFLSASIGSGGLFGFSNTRTILTRSFGVSSRSLGGFLSGFSLDLLVGFLGSLDWKRYNSKSKGNKGLRLGYRHC
jgi:hypothetical protein